MPATYEPISSTTLGSNTATVTLSDIPGTYTDLILVANLGGSTAQNVRLRVNSDTASNYSSTILYGTGSAAGSARYSSVSYIQTDNAAYPGTSVASTYLWHLMSYANTNVYKTILTSAATAGQGVARGVGLWRSTSAITSISVFLEVDNVLSGSTFSLYGVKAA